MTETQPSPRQKMCNYCATPAAQLAVKCVNCGSVLPMSLPASLPRPVARAIEAQSTWSMGKTGLVTSGTSLLLGLAYNYGIPSGGIAALFSLLWLVVIMPGMVGISAIATAQRDAGKFLLNVFAALGFWVAGLVLVIIGGLLF